MSRTLVKDALTATAPIDAILLQGWVRTRRDAKAFSFAAPADGLYWFTVCMVDDQGRRSPDNPAEAQAALKVRVATAEVNPATR